VIGKSFLADSLLLRGRILDVGVGEGVTDLRGIFALPLTEAGGHGHRGFSKELPRVAQKNDLPLENLPEVFTFIQGSCENTSYADASFDVVIFWGRRSMSR
jgi:hypothetical protein